MGIFQRTVAEVRNTGWSIWVAGIHVFFTIITTLIPYLPRSIAKAFLRQLDMSNENNLAAWWSGTNLFILALLALELAAKTGERKAFFSWIALTLLFAGLSLDELGSLHERVSWEDLFFPAAIVGLLLISALGVLSQVEDQRKLVLPVILGCALWGLVAFLDHLEDLILLPAWSTGIRAGVEEGLELFGMFIILTALAGRKAHPEEPGKGLLSVIPDPLKLGYLPGVVLIGLVMHAGFSFLAASFSDLSVRGNPAVWYPMVLFFLLFSAGLWRATGQPAHQMKAYLILSGYFLLSSIATIYLISPRQGISRIHSFGLFSSFYFLYGCQLVLSVILYRSIFGPLEKKALFLFAVLALFLVLGFLMNELFVQFLIAGVFAFLIVYLFLLDGRHKMESRFLTSSFL